MCKLINVKSKKKYDVLITRPSKWGNPYSHLDYSTASYRVNSPEEAVQKFEEYLLNNPDLMASLHELKYKTIACVCGKNKPCHGKIIKKYVDQLEYMDEMHELLKNT